jgi:hypothetical protein
VSDIRKDRTAKKTEPAGAASTGKRPYKKPDFQHEKVFETMALACGKLSPTQAQCRFNRRNS